MTVTADAIREAYKELSQVVIRTPTIPAHRAFFDDWN